MNHTTRFVKLSKAPQASYLSILASPASVMGDKPPVWFITGASSGFGKYLTLEALSRGHKVVASARSLSRLADVKDAGADIVVLDVTSPLANIEKVAKEANDRYGYITHLVNVAGYCFVGAVEETS
jgi:NADP-dependent 3-hydroxy acid dehydrogenase YdfG